jgi:hypothetical protein
MGTTVTLLNPKADEQLAQGFTGHRRTIIGMKH